MQKRRLLLVAVVVALVGAGVGAFFAFRTSGPQHAAPVRRPPRSSAPDQVVVNAFGQSSPPAQGGGRPLTGTLAGTLGVFRSHRLAAKLPSPSGLMQPLSVVAAHMNGEPGVLLPNETRRVATGAGPLYLVPTTRGWACLQGEHFEGCEPDLLSRGISWSFESVGDGVDVVGLAADDVSGVALDYGKTQKPASLRDNVFFVHRPISLEPGKPYALGVLRVSYRDGKPTASVPLG